MQHATQILHDENTRIVRLINELKKERNAVILVHNYQRPEIYQIADYIADSLELSRKAAATSAETIVFCGVEFMAETAKILSPDKTVLLPARDAGCSLAAMATPEKLRSVKEMHPEAAVVSYVNTTAEIKALSDVCCTSMNAVKIVNSLPHDEIIFLPDKNLGRYVARHTKKKVILWDGYCFVHDKLNAQVLQRIKDENPAAKIIAHPECRDDLLHLADHVCGTGGMAKFAQASTSSDFIVVTECGMSQKLREDVPGKNFYSFCNLCPYMQSTTLPLVAQALIHNRHEITIPESIRVKAKSALDKMLEFP